MAKPPQRRHTSQPTGSTLIQRREARRQAINAWFDYKNVRPQLKETLLVLLDKMKPEAGNLSYISTGLLATLVTKNHNRRLTALMVDIWRACGAIIKVYGDRDYGRAQILELYNFDIGKGRNTPLSFYTFNPAWPGFRRVPTGKGRKTEVELPPEMLELIELMWQAYRADAATRRQLQPRVDALRNRFDVGLLNRRDDVTGDMVDNVTGDIGTEETLRVPSSRRETDSLVFPSQPRPDQARQESATPVGLEGGPTTGQDQQPQVDVQADPTQVARVDGLADLPTPATQMRANARQKSATSGLVPFFRGTKV
jgi:hypothetical protein